MESDVDFIRDENFKLLSKKEDVKKGFRTFSAFSVIWLRLNLGLCPHFGRPGT